MNDSGRENWPSAQSSQGQSSSSGNKQQSHMHTYAPYSQPGSTAPPPLSRASGPQSQSSHVVAAMARLQHPSPTENIRQTIYHPSGPIHPYLSSSATSLQYMGRSGPGPERDEPDSKDAALMGDLRRQVDMGAETRDRQVMGEGQIIHQPVAVAPSARVLGPNGILGNQAQQSIASVQASLIGPPQQQLFTPIVPTQPVGSAPPPQLLGSYSPAGPPSSNHSQLPILNDALSYLDQVKVQFQDQPDVYNHFLDIMKDFKSSVIDTPGVIDRVSQLFLGNPLLVQGFNTFLPPGYKIECGYNNDPNSIRVTTPMGTTSQVLQPRPPSVLEQRLPLACGSVPGPVHVPASASTSMPGPVPATATATATAPGSGSVPLSRPVDQLYEQARYAQGSSCEDIVMQDARGMPVAYGPGAPVHVSISPDARREQAGPLVAHLDPRGLPALQQAAPVLDGRMTSHRPANVTEATMGVVSLMNGHAAAIGAGGTLEKQRGPVEFNHAINYVNKIKNRFASQPDIYKQFLDILQTYQRESKPIGEVYTQVTNLFDGAPDLLEDFKQFLPDSAANNNASTNSNDTPPPPRKDAEETYPTSSLRSGTFAAGPPQQLVQQPSRHENVRLPPMGNFGPTPSSEKKNNNNNKRPRGVDRHNSASQSSGQPELSARSSHGNAGSSSKQNKRLNARQAAVEQLVTPVLSATLQTQAMASTAPTDKDFHMIERIRKQINNKTHFTEFIKLLNLYTQDLITPEYLVYRAQAWLSHDTEHIQWLRHLFGIQAQAQEVRNLSRLDRRVSLNRCRALGPSYRHLPKQEHTQLCSGRDELCRSVLNDEWASHPTMQSEEGGFVAHKKTGHEETLHRVEEERHDYDSSIECMIRTIQLLDPIVRHLKSMPEAARQDYKPDIKLGGQSETIYRRTIYKLYGRAAGNTVIEGLLSRCWSVAPTLLVRCKDTLEKWKAAQRQWNEIWRQATFVNYCKSLDPQGTVNNRNAEKRQFQQKTLVQEIKTLYEEQRKRRLGALTERRSDSHMTEGYQFVHHFKNLEVFGDTKMLIVDQLKAKLDDPNITLRVEQLLDSCTSNDDLSTAVHDSAVSETSEASESASSTARSGRRSKSLRKAALENTSRVEALNGICRDVTPTPSSGEDEIAVFELQGKQDDATPEDQDTWTDLATNAIPITSKHAGPRTDYHIYCNTSLYSFFRLFGLLYERLETLYDEERSVQKLVDIQLLTKPARSLGFIDREPSEFFPDPKNELDGNSYYKQVIDKIRTHITTPRDITQLDIEEILRRYYLQCGWRIYHFDKLLSHVERLIATIYDTDKDRGSELLELYRKDRKKTTVSYPEELRYRNHAQKMILGVSKEQQSELYRVTLRFPADATDEVDTSSHGAGAACNTACMMIQILDKDSPTIAATRDQNEKFNVYLSSYQLNEPTEDVPELTHANLPYMTSHMVSENEMSFSWAQIDSCENLSVKINDKYRARLLAGGSEAINSLRLEDPSEERQRRYNESRKLRAFTAQTVDDEEANVEGKALLDAVA